MSIQRILIVLVSRCINPFRLTKSIHTARFIPAHCIYCTVYCTCRVELPLTDHHNINEISDFVSMFTLWSTMGFGAGAWMYDCTFQDYAHNVHHNLLTGRQVQLAVNSKQLLQPFRQPM